MKKLCLCITFLSVIFFCSSLFAQTDVTVVVTINPPYSPYLSTYVDQPNKVLLTVINNTSIAQQLKLWVKISGDNGVSVTTAASFNPSQPITLAPHETKFISFNSSETRDYFDAGNVDLVGITKAQLIQNQALPEGNYTICVRALGYLPPYTLKSMDACATFPISYIDPPIPTQPYCGSSVAQITPQFILFSWTPPATAPGNIQYEFTLKEVPNTLNPNDVIKNNAFPVIYNTTQTGNTTLPYTVALPQLEAGKKYVWRVKAVDPFNTVQFKNAGYSEACFFIYGTEVNNSPVAVAAPNIHLLLPKDKAEMEVVKSISSTGVSDHYKFTWSTPAIIPGVGISGYTLRIAPVDSGQTAQQALAGNKVKQIAAEDIGKGVYLYTSLGDFIAGKTYAWEVRGLGNTDTYNKYYSEQWTFTVKKTYGTYKVSGNLFYSYSLPPAAGFQYARKGVSNSSTAGFITMELGSSSSASSGSKSFPYANKKINFYKAVIVKEGSGTNMMDATPFLMLEKIFGGNPVIKDAGDWVGSAITDGNGHFEVNTDAILGNVMDTAIKGTTYHYIKVLKVSVSDEANVTAKANPYVNNPDEYLIVDGNVKDVKKDFYARVKSYKLKVTFKELPKKNYYNPIAPTEPHVKNLTIYILRKPRVYINSSSPNAFPKNECLGADAASETISIGGITYDVVGKKNAVTGVACTFSDLIINDMDYLTDRICVYAKYANDDRVIMTPVKFRTGDWETGSSYNLNTTYQASSDWELKYNNGNYTRSLTIIPDQLITSSISGNLKGRYAKTLPPGDEKNNIPDFALANTKVLLKAVYVIKTGAKEVLAANLPASVTGKYSGSDIFGVDWTDGNGNFKFNFNIYSDSSTQATKIGFLQKYGGGDLYRVLRVVVTNPFYYSPDNSFVVDGGYEYEVGELIANVCEVRATGRLVEEWTQGQASWKPIANQRVKLVMYDPGSLYPKVLGDKNSIINPAIKDDAGDTYKVISETTTNSEGKFTFSRLVAHGDGNSIIDDETFYLYVEPDEISSNNFKTTHAIPFPTGFSYGWGKSGKQFNAEQPAYIPETNYDGFEAKPLLPTIRGAIHPLSNMGYTTLADAHVYCIQIPEDKWKVLGYLESDAATAGTTLSDQIAIYGIGGMTNWFGWTILKEKITGEDGKFVFANLPVKSVLGGKPYRYLIYVEKNGFLYEARKAFGGAQPKKGQQESMMLDLRLPITVKTKLVDSETGAGVNAKVIVGNNYSWAQTYAANCVMWMCDAKIELKCPVGKVKLYIYPENMDAYMPDSVTIDVKNGSNGVYEGIQKIAVRPRMHDIDFMVYDKATDALLPYMGAQLINANVGSFKGSNCTNGTGEPNMLKNHVGHATFNSTATKFEFIVYGADINNISYVPKRVTVNSDPQFYEGWNEQTVKLDRGFQLKGFVKNDKGGGVQGVHVFVDESQTSTPVETYTAADGSFTLKGIPYKTGIKIFCAKSGGNLIGDFAYVSFTSSIAQQVLKITNGVYSYTHNFKVTECTTMDISSMLGFPMEIISFDGNAQGGAKIWGNFVSLPGNEIIKAAGNQKVPFSAVEVVPGSGTGPSGKPKCEPKTLPVYTDEYNIDLKVFDKFFAKLNGNIFIYQGIALDKESALIPGSAGGGPGNFQQPKTVSYGVLKGFFSLTPSSFPKGAKFDLANITAWPKGAQPSDMYAAFTGNGFEPQGKLGFAVGKYNGKNMTFNLFNRYPGAEAVAAKSQLDDGGLRLNTIIHTKLNYVDSSDIHLNIGDVVLGTNSVTTQGSGGSEIKLPLGKWSFTSTDWQCNESGGLVIKNGTVNTGISIPMKNMSVTYTDLLYGEPQLDNISLAGIVTLQMIPGTIKSFGFDKGIGKGAWSFVMLPAEGKNYCAKFGSLYGMTGGSQFKVASVRSYSNGYPNKIMLVNDNSDVKIHQIASFSPGTIDAGSDNITMKGAIDFGVPFLKYNDNFTMKWIKKNGEIKVEFDNPGEMSLHTKGIKCKFPATAGKYVFENGKLELTGVMVDENDKGNYAFDVTLKRTPGNASVSTLGTNNKFLYAAGNNKRGIEKVVGKMETGGATTWNSFKFEGDLFSIPAEKGIKETEKHVKMDIKGDIVAQPGNKVGVEGANTPFGNMSFAYDFTQGAFVGSSHMETQSGNQSLSMDVEMMMGSGKWYFFGSGKVAFPPDFWIKEASAASFVGRVNSFPSTISSKFNEYSVTGNLPSVIKPNGFTGLIAAAGIKMPIPKVPTFNISFGPFGSAGLTHEIKANITTALNFDGSPTFGFNVNGNVYLKVYAGASIGIGCVHAEGEVNATVDVNGCISVAPVSAALSGSVWIDVSASGEAGVGCCDSDCDHPWYCPCVTAGAGFCLQTSASVNYNTNGSKDIEFGGFDINGSCQPHTPFPVITCGQ